MNADKCKICHMEGRHLQNILENEQTNEVESSHANALPMLEMLNSLLGLKIFNTCIKNEKAATETATLYICEICRNAASEAYKFKKQLEQAYDAFCHTVEMGTQTERCLCNKCDVSYRNKKCGICGKELSRVEHLRRHMRTVHGIDSEDRMRSCSNNGDEEHTKLDSKPMNANDSWLNNPTVLLLEPEIMLTTNNMDDENFKHAYVNDYAMGNNHSLHTNPLPSDDETNDNVSNMELPSFFNAIVAKELNIKLENNNTELNEAHNNEAQSIVAAADIKQEVEDKDNKQSETITKSKCRKERSSSTATHAAETEVISCQQCNHTFSRRCHLKRHMLTHLDEKPNVCSFCEKRFSRKDHLKNHIASVHATKDIKCQHCDALFSRKDHLERHMECKHNEEPNAHKKYECEFCQKKFSTKSYLQKHILLHTERVYACKYCDVTFKERKPLREHEKIHNASERNFLCSLCGESFLRNDYLIVHMRRHNGEKPYKCQYCGKGFPRSTDLKMHERYHTGTKPNKCNLCGKAFHRAYNLTIHMRTHTGERPYQCEQCSKCFAQSNDLKAHIRRHTGERYKCTECSATFLQLYSMRQHAFTAHGIKIHSINSRLQKYIPAVPAMDNVKDSNATVMVQP